MNQFAKFARWLIVIALSWGILIGCGQQPQGKMPHWIPMTLTPAKATVVPIQPITLLARIGRLETMETGTFTIRPSGIVTVTQVLTQSVTALDVSDGVIEFSITAAFMGTGKGELIVHFEVHSTTEDRARWEWRLEVGQTSNTEVMGFYAVDDRVSMAEFSADVAYKQDLDYQYTHDMLTLSEYQQLLSPASNAEIRTATPAFLIPTPTP